MQKWPHQSCTYIVKFRIDEVKLGEQYYAILWISISINVNSYQELAYLTFILRTLMFIFSTIKVRSSDFYVIGDYGNYRVYTETFP